MKFPGAQPLEIEVFDYDDLFGDELIGKTVIDLDDRQFSPDWKSIKNKPIEFR
jgi:Ca2+-dependent lipid-binding protein